MIASNKLRVLVAVAVIAVSLLCYSALAGPTNNIVLAWDWSDSNTNGIMYRGTASGVYSTNFPVRGTNEFADFVPLSVTYYYAVTAVNDWGDESERSRELAIQRVRPKAPMVSKYTVTLK
jgi:hypothetical protein